MCVDGSVDKCDESDFKQNISCTLEDCPKTFGVWSDVGPCISDGVDPMCGPGKQNQTRWCSDGTIDNCTYSDRQQTVPCSLIDCAKSFGEWNDVGPCQPDASGRNCGPGIQKRSRNCTNGTRDICTYEDRNQQTRCNLTACPKILGLWSSDGICQSSENDKNCGKGLRKQKRSCISGTYDSCTKNDTEKYIECSLESCFKEVGNWTDQGICVGSGERDDCGPGLQKQSRTCVDGANANCTSADIERNVPCSLPDCVKLFGTWINEGDCIASGDEQCGPGNQTQTRTCLNGTHIKCTEADMLRVQSCNLQHCKKVFGDWFDVGECNATGVDKTCGPGEKRQQRSCQNGTIDQCTERDKERSISCSLPDCPKKVGNWSSIGGCIADDDETSCGDTGSGNQKQHRTCTDGTTEKCRPSDREQVIACELPKCPSKLIDVRLYFPFRSLYVCCFYKYKYRYIISS